MDKTRALPDDGEVPDNSNSQPAQKDLPHSAVDIKEQPIRHQFPALNNKLATTRGRPIR